MLNLPWLVSTPSVLILSVVLGFITLFVMQRSKRSTHGRKEVQYSVALEGSSKDADDGARRSPLTTHIVHRLYDDVTTVYEAFLRSVKRSGDQPFLGTWDEQSKDYKWLTYKQVHDKAGHVGSGLVALGCRPSQETFIGIYSSNCVEWDSTDLACQMFSMVTVPMYDTLGSDACVYIINHAKLETVVCHSNKIQLLLQAGHHCEVLKNIIKIGASVSTEENAQAEKLGIKIMSFTELEELGRKIPHEIKPARPEDILTVCFTSGTSGPPKGVIVTHANMIADISGYRHVLWKDGTDIYSTDVHLSFLPLAHMYERLNHLNMFLSGCKIGFYRGDMKKLMEDLQTLKPTVFTAVPRLLNKIYDQVMAKASQSPFKKWVFEFALGSKESDLKRGIIRKDTIWDRFIFRPIQNLLGGRVRMMVTGSAPLSDKVANFTKCVMGCSLQEGYGQTECSAAATFQWSDDTESGHVGGPVPCNIIKLVDVAEMEYFAKNGQGEICIKGPNVSQGYLHNPEKTAETFDKDGWLHTTDIGQWLPNGALKIIDRKKDIFKLSQGEYIAPQKIEAAYRRSPYVAQVFVWGNSLESFAVAIVVPDFDFIKSWPEKSDFEGDIRELCKDKDVHRVILQDLISKGSEAGLNSLEQVKGIYLHPEMFSVENKLLTATLKAKRREIHRFFENQINQLYNEAEHRS